MTGAQLANTYVYTHGDTLFVDVGYPGHDSVQYINVGVNCARAIDDIRIHFDFERDGWVIRQRPGIYDDGLTERAGNWQEVTFIPRWQLEQRAGGTDETER